MGISDNNINIFGLNVHIPKRTIKQVKDTAAKHLGEIVAPIFNYLDENEKVFNGDIKEELNKYYALMYSYGQVARKGQSQSTFSVDA